MLNDASIESIVSDFRNAVLGPVSVAKEGLGRYRVFAPFTLWDGDHLSIILRREGDGWVLSDEGNACMRFASGADERVLCKIVADILTANQIEDRDGELIFRVQDDCYGDALLSFSQALFLIEEKAEDYLMRLNHEGP